MTKRRVECNIDENLLKQIDRAASLLHLSRTDFIVAASTHYLHTIRRNIEPLKVES